MKKETLYLALLMSVLGIVLAGCGNDEIKADPAIVNSMNKQRGATAPGHTPPSPPASGAAATG